MFFESPPLEDHVKRLQDKKIYFLGIGGIGMGGLALALKQLGCVVAGADRSEPYDPMKGALRSADISISYPWSEEHIRAFQPDYVVIGNVCTADNPLVKWTLEQNIPFDHMAKMAGALARLGGAKYTVVVAGTHGKTTTAMLLRHVCTQAGLRTGSFVGGFDGAGQNGVCIPKTQDVFVYEGDEYDCAFFDKQPKFMYYGGDFAILSACEMDHVDIYPTFDDMVDAYKGWIRTLPLNAKLWVSSELAQQPTWRDHLRSVVRKDTTVLTFGGKTATQTPDVSFELLPDGSVDIYVKQELVGHHGIPALPNTGFFQSMCVAYGVGKALGMNNDQVTHAIASFSGVKRRFNILRTEGVVVIDDFAHHPSAVAMNLQAIRRVYPNQRVMAVFEPRSATSRRNILLQQWKQAFQGADGVIFAPIFQGSSVKDQDSLNISEICADMTHKGKIGVWAKTEEELKTYVVDQVRGQDVWVLFSNGDLSAVAKVLKDIKV